MRPRFVLTILLIIEIFCLVLVFSPGLWRSKAQISAAGAMRRNRTPETERAYQQAHDRAGQRSGAIGEMQRGEKLRRIGQGAIGEPLGIEPAHGLRDDRHPEPGRDETQRRQ